MQIRKNPSHNVLLAVFITLIFGLVCASGAPGQEPAHDTARMPLDRFLNEIQKQYRGTKALAADFTQTYSAGGGTRTESGRVIFAQGGRMRWDYEHPEAKVFVSNGKTVDLYLPSEHQLEKSSVKASEDYRVPFRLLLSRLDFKKYFAQIEDASGEQMLAPGDRIIVGIPKGGKDRPYDKVLIEFDSRMDIRRLEITYRDESRMEFVFSHIRRNPPVANSTFDFTPPAGTEIIDQSGQNSQ